MAEDTMIGFKFDENDDGFAYDVAVELASRAMYNEIVFDTRNPADAKAEIVQGAVGKSGGNDIGRFDDFESFDFTEGFDFVF